MRKMNITDKLTFEGNPCLVIKDKEFEVNANAPTMLKVMALMGKDPSPDEIISAYELMFKEKERVEIEKLNLNFNDLITVIQSAVELIVGEGSQGE